MRSRRTKPVRISVSEEEEEDSSNNGGSSRPQASSSFKKRPPLKKKQVKTSFGQTNDGDDDNGIDNDDPVVLKRNRRPKTLMTSMAKTSIAPTASSTTYSTEHLDELRNKTEQRPKKQPEDSATGVEDSAPDLEDYIAIDKESKDLAYSGYDIEEGAGFEDEQLPIGRRDQKLQAFRHRKEMEDAINEIPSDEEEEDEWEHSQIQKAVGTNKSDLPRPTTEVPEMAPIPSISEVLGDLKSILSNLEIKKNDHSEQLEDLKTDLERIQDKEKSLQETLDKAAEDYNLAQSSLNR